MTSLGMNIIMEMFNREISLVHYILAKQVAYKRIHMNTCDVTSNKGEEHSAPLRDI